ncbi:MAG: Y-family DNA polymerase, partial [Kiritimatiellae bacterium]|nr:Y-family DNA polymerase [Kiritimatiellia bacterium]
MIALIDANNFYVSCERIFNLSLTGKPVAVLSNNDGCVISRSQEFKALGIAMGTPYFQLREWVSSGAITLCSSNYELYGDISRRIVDILGGFSADVEPYSIDEAFVHFPDTPGVDRFALGKAIRERLLKWIGIPCGVGFAPSRTLAKIANHIGKKSESGIFVMPDDPTPILAELPVSEVWGIGRRLEPKLTRIGIQTAAQLAAADPVEIRRRFSVTVAQTVLELRGQSVIKHEDP